MPSFALELNDAGFIAVRKDAPREAAVPESPGYALFEDSVLLTGNEARGKARLRPRYIHTRFWDSLDTGALERPFPSKLTRADLAHAHLSGFWSSLPDHVGSDVVLAIPGWYSLEQLGLILGMARASQILVTGMIDSALAASATSPKGTALIHLDLHLHRAVAARVLRDDKLIRESTLVDETVGLLSLRDAWVTAISESFVRRTRFDPLHSAETEQRMYDELPSWLEGLGDQDAVTIRLPAGRKEQTLELEAREIVRSAEPYYDSIAALAASLLPPEHAATLLVSDRLAVLPGLLGRLRRDVCDDLVVLPRTAAATGALTYAAAGADTAEGDELTFLTSLSLGDETSTPRAQPSERPDTRRPTHLLHAGTAYPLAPEPFLLGVSIPGGKNGLNLTGATAGISRYHCSIYRVDEQIVVEDHSKFGSFLNGQRVDDKEILSAGDRLRLGTPGIEVELIQVRD